MIISGVKVFISGDYIKCLYQVIISSVYIEESKSATEYYSRMLALWGSWMIPLVEVDEKCRLRTWCHLYIASRLSSCIGSVPSR